ncbi:MAG: 3D domain-containing protein [Gaiellaceae bacterium]
MLGQAHTPRRRLLPFAAVALVVLATPAVSGAIPSHGSAALRAHDAALAAKSRAAVLDLYSIDQHLAAAQSRLASLHTQQESLQAERALVAQELAIAKRGTQIAQTSLGARLRLLYEQGNVEPLEIVFGSKTLDEALTNLENLSRMTGQAEDILRQLKAARVTAAGASRRLAQQDAALAASVREAQATAGSLAAERAARTTYIGSLAEQRRLTQGQIAAVVAQATSARIRSQQLTRTTTAGTVAVPSPSAVPTFDAGPSAPAPAPATTPAAAPPSIGAPAGRTITVSATGYSLPGHTATGLPVGWGVAAVDPSVIGLGTHMTVPGYGEAVAADTGGAVVGTTIDLWFPTLAQANAWGRRTVTITLH